jgi:hypothetical protein
MDEDRLLAYTIVVVVLCVLVLVIPFFVSGNTTLPDEKTIVFISIVPDGNQSVSTAVMSVGTTIDTLVFELDSYIWAQIACICTAAEAVLLWGKVRSIYRDESVLTQSLVLSYGGAYTANNEFWSFVGVHHVILLMLTMAPISLHALLLFVLVYVSAMSSVCEPVHEDVEDSSHLEVYTNHVVSICVRVICTIVLVVVDQRLNRSVFAETGMRGDSLMLQVFFDLVLVMLHASPDIGIVYCYLGRVVYTFSCAVTIMWWLCSRRI